MKSYILESNCGGGGGGVSVLVIRVRFPVANPGTKIDGYEEGTGEIGVSVGVELVIDPTSSSSERLSNLRNGLLRLLRIEEPVDSCEEDPIAALESTLHV